MKEKLDPMWKDQIFELWEQKNCMGNAWNFQQNYRLFPKGMAIQLQNPCTFFRRFHLIYCWDPVQHKAKLQPEPKTGSRACEMVSG